MASHIQILALADSLPELDASPTSPLGRTLRDPVLDSKNYRVLCFCVHSQLQCQNSYSIYSVLAAITESLSRSGQPPQDNLKQRQTVCISLQFSTRWPSNCSFFIYLFLPFFSLGAEPPHCWPFLLSCGPEFLAHPGPHPVV